MARDGRGLRLGVLGIVAISLFATLFARLWYLQMMSPERLDQQVQTSRVRTVQLAPMRGRIFDRNGMVMADNRRVLSVTIDRAEIRSAAKRKILFTRLSGPLQTPVEDLEARYIDVQYDPYLPLPLADDVPETTAIYLGERREDYPGVEVSEGWQRVYRYAPLASHIVGYMGAIPAESAKAYRGKGYKLNERVGKAGIEEQYEGQLRGKPGSITYEVDARNRIIREISRRDPVPGNDIVLSIDLQLQQYAEQTLQQGLREARTRCPFDSFTQSCGGPAFAAPAGSTVVEDPRNGQILAMATYPTFDNRWFVEGISNKKIQELYPDADKQAPFVNRALSSPFQMGSTFKLVSTVAGLQSGIITPGSPYNDQGKYQIPNCDVAKFKCIFKNAGLARGSGPISLATALTISSDTYYYRIGAELQLAQNPTLQNVARQFGYGSDSGIDLPAEISGTVPDAALKKHLAERTPPVISLAQRTSASLRRCARLLPNGAVARPACRKPQPTAPPTGPQSNMVAGCSRMQLPSWGRLFVTVPGASRPLHVYPFGAPLIFPIGCAGILGKNARSSSFALAHEIPQAWTRSMLPRRGGPFGVWTP